ncbi:DUF3576 domain-containing protein [Plastoroseomonas hellenica]|uniref:DUF3576 domain-containing protein n=1 Tax=Plastoroseomonas hellenica TaxID=2687306 RepID=A0ABS5F381_9PROT|nr:DUF3576 domain-containing protein [Plastoroseomonas hellenica]MBR0644385.1 DUF3576 domain-containing protein [Plastoroseomonas hellenica]MBR0667025.1 DUF3576 domain-containing protein [Plastoroseomonas hellenica]
MRAKHLLLALIPGLALLGACGGRDDGNLRTPGRDEYNDNSGRARTLGRSDPAGTGVLIFGTDRSGDRGGAGGDSGSGLGVNAYLWRATLDTLSFMPLASADPFGGVIITDWYTPAASPGERFKATAYVLGRQLRSDGIRVSLFRQIRGANGQWSDAPVSTGTGAELEDRVLARARELRSQSASR